MLNHTLNLLVYARQLSLGGWCCDLMSASRFLNFEAAAAQSPIAEEEEDKETNAGKYGD